MKITRNVYKNERVTGLDLIFNNKSPARRNGISPAGAGSYPPDNPPVGAQPSERLVVPADKNINTLLDDFFEMHITSPAEEWGTQNKALALSEK